MAQRVRLAAHFRQVDVFRRVRYRFSSRSRHRARSVQFRCDSQRINIHVKVDNWRAYVSLHVRLFDDIISRNKEHRVINFK